MANYFIPGVSAPMAGLNDFTCTVVTTGQYVLDAQATLPVGSALQIVLKKNSTTLITVGGQAYDPTPTQPSIGARTNVLCSAGDVMHVVLTSANAVDANPNTVKTIINFYPGV